MHDSTEVRWADEAQSLCMTCTPLAHSPGHMQHSPHYWMYPRGAEGTQGMDPCTVWDLLMNGLDARCRTHPVDHQDVKRHELCIKWTYCIHPCTALGAPPYPEMYDLAGPHVRSVP